MQSVTDIIWTKSTRHFLVLLLLLAVSVYTPLIPNKIQLMFPRQPGPGETSWQKNRNRQIWALKHVYKQGAMILPPLAFWLLPRLFNTPDISKSLRFEIFYVMFSWSSCCSMQTAQPLNIATKSTAQAHSPELSWLNIDNDTIERGQEVWSVGLTSQPTQKR